MSNSLRARPVLVASAVVALLAAVVVSFAFAGLAGAAAAPTGAHEALSGPSTGAPADQWAFGGSASSSFSCTLETCFLGNVTPSGVHSFDMSWQYTLSWSVIYQQINVSSNQTEVGVQGAVGLDAAFQFSDCMNATGSATGPCSPVSESVSLYAFEMATGYTNISNGTVDQLNSSAGPTGPIPALAISNASSSFELNVSGSFSVSESLGGQSISGTIGFLVGSSASSSIQFSPALGIVPTHPATGQVWNDTSAYTAQGNWKGGYLLTDSGITLNDTWAQGSVTPSGNLTVNGTDLGPVTLWDNYSTPHTQSTADEISLDFLSGNFSATDGWLLFPTQVVSGIGLFGNLTGIASGGPVGPALSPAPSQGNNTTLSVSSQETADFVPGTGFVGAALNANAPDEIGVSGASTPTVAVTAGPEPVSVAEQQIQAILAGPPKPGSSPFPWMWLAIGAVAVVAVGAGVGLALRRSAGRRKPPTAWAPATPPPAYRPTPPPANYPPTGLPPQSPPPS
jgi:hypothetical protein